MSQANKKVTFKEDVLLIKDIDVRRAVESYVRSIMSKLYKFFITKPYLDLSTDDVVVNLYIKVRNNCVFYPSGVELDQKVVDSMKNTKNRYLIGVKSMILNESKLTIGCVEHRLRSNPLKSTLRTKVNNVLIVGNVFLIKSNLKTTCYGTVESEEDTSVESDIVKDSVYEGIFEEYSKNKLRECNINEERLRCLGTKVFLNRRELRLSCMKGKVNSSYPRLLLERKLGRSLTKEETCDHIDGNPLNNNPENLRVLLSRENTLIASLGSKRRLSAKCIKNIRKCKKGYRPPESSVRKMIEGRRKFDYPKQTRDKMSRSIKLSVIRNARKGKLSGKAKLTYSQVVNYRSRFEKGEITRREILDETGLDPSSVYRLLHYKTYAYNI